MKKEEIFREHFIREKNKYTPRYIKGMIGVRFVDDESRGDKYKTITNEGELIINYHELFNDKYSEIVRYFEDKYEVKMSDYRSGTDDFYHYFECEDNEKDNKMMLISKDKMVKIVDYVDERYLESEDILYEVKYELNNLEFGGSSDEKIKNTINLIIEKLNNLL